jgi:hypothetical protein
MFNDMLNRYEIEFCRGLIRSMVGGGAGVGGDADGFTNLPK